MSGLEKFVRWVTGESSEEPRPVSNPQEASMSHGVESLTGSRAGNPTGNPAGGSRAGLPPVENDAAAYGVTVEPAQVAPGTRYWRVRRVHHLTPEENGGKHHIFLEALTPDGQRAFQSQARITWDGGEQVVVIDKPLGEPGANFPMWKWQVCSVEMLGLPSDRVSNLHTAHPDEPNPDGSQSGNTLFHHSFLVEFQETVAPGQETGVIQGQIKDGRAGVRVELLQGEGVVAAVTADEQGRFAFQDVPAGSYTLHAGGTNQPVTVEAGKTTDVVLALTPPRDSIIEGTVRNGEGLILRLVQEGAVLVEGPLGASGAFRLKGLGPGDYFVQVLWPGETEPVAMAGPISVDGSNRRQVDLTVPAPPPAPSQEHASPLTHYLLFPPADRPESQVLLTLLAPVIAEQGLAFGFQPQEAAQAQEVTLVGGPELIPLTVEEELRQAGVAVRRLSGSPEEILAGMDW